MLPKFVKRQIVPKNRVAQFHIAGHLDKGEYLLDTHDHTIRDEVWDLYKKNDTVGCLKASSYSDPYTHS